MTQQQVVQQTPVGADNVATQAVANEGFIEKTNFTPTASADVTDVVDGAIASSTIEKGSPIDEGADVTPTTLESAL